MKKVLTFLFAVLFLFSLQSFAEGTKKDPKQVKKGVTKSDIKTKTKTSTQK